MSTVIGVPDETDARLADNLCAAAHLDGVA